MKLRHLTSGSYFHFSATIEAHGFHAIRSCLLYMAHDRQVLTANGSRPVAIEKEWESREVTPCTNYGTPLHLTQS